MVRYSDGLLDEIRSRLDIVGVISEYVPLNPSGKSYKGLCPFHQEKTPSFMVDPEKQIFHCFGCGEGGNIFSFIMKIEKTHFPEAVKILADKAGVQLPTNNDRENRHYQEKEILFRLNQITADYYQKNLFAPQGKHALDYLLRRHFEKEIIKKYHLGYAFSGYEHLIHFLLSQKVMLSDLSKAGLVSKSKKSGNFMDYFRDRVIFPIMNLQGKVIAFGGRVLGDKLPKYINSPETPVYSKGKHLYGMFQAKGAIRQKNQVIIVEGYTDVLIAHQNGFENVVASLGTALTTGQINIIKRYAEEVIIAFDSDAAGRNAALRGLHLIKKAGIKVKIISLPTGRDPADVIIEKGKGYFAEKIKQALPIIDYKINMLIHQYDQKTSEGKIAIVRGLFSDLADIYSQVELQIEVKKIAERLGLEEESILKDLNRYRKGSPTLPNIVSKDITESRHMNAEKIVIGSMLQNKNIIERIFSQLNVEDFSVKEHRDIVLIIKELFEKREKVHIQKVIDELNDPHKTNLLSQIMLKDVVLSDNETIDRSIKAIKEYRLQIELNRIKEKIKQEEKEKREVTPGLLQDYQNILHKIKTIV